MISLGGNVNLNLKMANRHGLITGATGTGKTTTIKTLIEGFSKEGVVTFCSDVKGDLSGIAKNFPVTFWDIYSENGVPARTTISEMGPVLLSKLMGLNEVQEDVLTVVFKIADDNGLLLLDTKDLKSMLTYVAENNKDFSASYGNIATQTVNTIIRNIVALEAKGGEHFFTEPAINVADFFIGNGQVNILDSKKLINDPTLYSSFLIYLLSELYTFLPEVGDLDKPRLVFFFDEAHLIFRDMNKGMLEKFEQMIKLIRSKGVGVYFISQTPNDIPNEILSQLSNKIQHGLRAYTPLDEKVVKGVASTFRVNPNFDTFTEILNLGKGEAIVSVLDDMGVPTISEKVKINPPLSMDVNITDDEKKRMVLSSNLYLRYKDEIDRDSAYEYLQRTRVEKEETAIEKSKVSKDKNVINANAKKVAKTAAGSIGREAGKMLGKAIGGSFGKTLGGNIGAELGRSILGTFLK